MKISWLLLPALLHLNIAHAADEGVTPLKNPTFAQVAAEGGVPEHWQAYPPPSGESSIAIVPAGGVRIADQNASEGLGLAQWIDVTPGHTYTAEADLTGTGGLFIYLTFAPAIPAKVSDLKTTKLAESRQWISAAKKPPLTVTAPAGAKRAQVWLYSAKEGRCDLVVKSVSVKESASAPAGTPTSASPAKLPGAIVQVVDFETGDFSQATTLEGGKKEVVSSPEPVRAGKHAMKVMMNHNHKRSEMTGMRSGAYGEFKYGWSIYIPDNFDGLSSFSIVTQWHDYGSGKVYETDGGPPTSLYIANDTWRFKLKYQDGDTSKTLKNEFALGSINSDRGKWIDFVMEVNWQSPKTEGGYLRLFKNGEKVVDYAGPTWYDEKTTGPYFKMGVYKGGGSWKGEDSRCILYFDEFRMGGKDTVWKDLSPSALASNG